ncbi:MAG: hypothetical protein GY860_14045 [Desulfobacteraceae bacterium]|nr:hypothetical protein [Desulfobacteraceae bacterium]
MNKVLNEIKSIPGIIGGFFFDSIQGIKTSSLPPVFKEENLNKIGTVLDKMYMMSNQGLKDISDLCLYYEESTIIMRRIGKTSSFIILCDPSLNQNLLTMSMNMLADEFKIIGTKFENANENKEEIVEVSTPMENLSEEEVINNSPVSGQLQGMQTALLKILGPMATIIFKEAVRDWIKSEAPSETSIPILLEILANEINDPEKEEKYLTLISPYIENITDHEIISIDNKD